MCTYIYIYIMTSSHTNKYNQIHKSKMNNTNVNQERKRPDRHGANNPMFNRKHSQQSKEKMSQAATLRNQQYKQAMMNQHHISMDEFLKGCKNEGLDIEGYIKTLVKEDSLKKIIREEIDKLIWKAQKKS